MGEIKLSRVEAIAEVMAFTRKCAKGGGMTVREISAIQIMTKYFVNRHFQCSRNKARKAAKEVESCS